LVEHRRNHTISSQVSDILRKSKGVKLTPPSRSCATIAPAHLPELKPQQPLAQSASLVHAPVMNWVPVPTLPLDPDAGAEAPVFIAGGAAAAVAGLVAPAMAADWEAKNA
jgi:hypothetical protein